MLLCCALVLLQYGCGGDVRKAQARPFEAPHGEAYKLTERYEIVGGPSEGMTGESVYTVRVTLADGDGQCVIDNFANAYTVRAVVKDDSLFIPIQKFAYYDDSVSISGVGRLRSDTLSLDYMSGGPAGQIKCHSKGTTVAH